MWTYQQFVSFLKMIHGNRSPKNVATLPAQIDLGLFGTIARTMLLLSRQDHEKRERGRAIHLTDNRVLIDKEDTVGVNGRVTMKAWGRQPQASTFDIFEQFSKGLGDLGNFKRPSPKTTKPRQSIGDIHTHVNFCPFSPRDISGLLAVDSVHPTKLAIMINFNSIMMAIRTSLTPKLSKENLLLVEKAWDLQISSDTLRQFEVLRQNCARWDIALFCCPLTPDNQGLVVKKITA